MVLFNNVMFYGMFIFSNDRKRLNSRPPFFHAYTSLMHDKRLVYYSSVYNRYKLQKLLK